MVINRIHTPSAVRASLSHNLAQVGAFASKSASVVPCGGSPPLLPPRARWA